MLDHLLGFWQLLALLMVAYDCHLTGKDMNMRIGTRDKVSWSSGLQVYQTAFGKSGDFYSCPTYKCFSTCRPALFLSLIISSSPYSLSPGEADVEVAGFTEGYVFVVVANGSLVDIELDRASVEVVVEDKGWCRWRVSTFVLYQEREG